VMTEVTIEVAVDVCLAIAHKQIMNGHYLFDMCSATF
jgi:hypothetical protein